MTDIKYEVHPFGCVVGEFTIDESITNGLLEEANKIRNDKKLKIEQRANHFLAGHLKEEYSYDSKIKDFYMEKLSKYFGLYRQIHCQFHRLKPINLNFFCNHLWVNFMKENEFNPIHTHSEDYSFVIYLATPDLKKEEKEFDGNGHPPGCIGFHYGEPQPKHHKYTTYARYFFPEKNKMFIFPALLQHWVSPYKTKGERISVSGNIIILNKDTIPEYDKGYF